MAKEDFSQEIDKYKRRLNAVLEITKRLSAKHSLDDLLHETLNATLEAVHASGGSLLLYDEAKKELVFRYVVGEKKDLLAGKAIQTNQGIAGQVFQSGQPCLLEDVKREKTHLTQFDWEMGFVTQDMATVALKSLEGRSIGVMQVLNKKEGLLNREDLALVQIMAALAATAIENARVYEAKKITAMAGVLTEVNHDFKNMLNPVVLSVKTIEMLWSRIDELPLKSQLPPACSQIPVLLENIRKRVLELQERILEFSDCAKGIMSSPHFEVWNVNEVIERAAQACETMAKEAGIILEKRLDWALPQTRLDPHRFYNALYNLIDNAVHATPPGGKVTLKSSFSKKNKGFPEDGFVAIEVEDSGTGISPEILERLFKDEMVTASSEGTGLGTRIVKYAVDAHQGILEVKTKPGEGTTILIKLPFWGHVFTINKSGRA